MGVWLFLVTEILFFGGMFCAFFVFRSWYYDAFASTAALSAGDFGRAIELGRRSLRANRSHTSTLRAIAISQSLAGYDDDARKTVAELLALQPCFTVSQYLARHPASSFDTGRTWAEALGRAQPAGTRPDMRRARARPPTPAMRSCRRAQ